MITFPEVFDSSIMSDLKSCMAKFDLAHRQDWKGKGVNVHLHAGGCFAKGCEVTRQAFYMGEHDLAQPKGFKDDGMPILEWKKTHCPPGDAAYAIEAGMAALLMMYGNFEAPEYGSGNTKTADRMAGAFLFYWDNYPLSNDTAYPVMLPGNKRGIEYSFAHPLPIDHPETGNPIIYAGRLDAILNYAGGHYGFDEKTTTSLGSTWSDKWSLRGQFLGYTWGSRENGMPLQGIVVRGVSILKTKYETQESINKYLDWQVDQWYAELLSWIRNAISAWQVGFYTHNYDETCTQYGGCPFKKICLSQDPTPWLETYFEQRHWDPVTRTETKLLK